jgi:hypothetical protein
LDSFEDTLSEDTIKELAEQYYNETYGGIKWKLIAKKF